VKGGKVAVRPKLSAHAATPWFHCHRTVEMQLKLQYRGREDIRTGVESQCRISG
jgi:hypothetical protein